jgi:hypothetical protein
MRRELIIVFQTYGKLSDLCMFYNNSQNLFLLKIKRSERFYVITQ